MTGRTNMGPATLAAFGLATVLVLAGCPTEDGEIGVVKSVTAVSHPDNPGFVVAGEKGNLNYSVTVVGEGVFPLDLAGPDVKITLPNGGPLPSGISVDAEETGKIEASGESGTLSLTIDMPPNDARNYLLRVFVHGVEAADAISAGALGPRPSGELDALGKDGEPLPSEITVLVHREQRVSPRRLEFDGQEIEITIKSANPGNPLGEDGKPEAVMQLERTGSMFTVGKGVTLTIADLELSWPKGDYVNNAPLIIVEDGGKVKLLDGAVIAGNVNLNTGHEGGGVRVNEGGELFIEDKAAIVANYSAQGGGVYIAAGGKVVMRGPNGTIAGNGSFYGGAVSNRGRFEMWDGAIYVNDAIQGGAVNNQPGATFIMLGGVILANQAERDTRNQPGSYAGGGGVYNLGEFQMHGGQISNNVVRDFGYGNYGGGIMGINFVEKDGTVKTPGRTVITGGILWNNRDGRKENFGQPGNGYGNIATTIVGDKGHQLIAMARIGAYSLDPNDGRYAGWTGSEGPVPFGKPETFDPETEYEEVGISEWRNIYFYAPPAVSYPLEGEIPLSVGRPHIENGEIVLDEAAAIQPIIFPANDLLWPGGTMIKYMTTEVWLPQVDAKYQVGLFEAYDGRIRITNLTDDGIVPPVLNAIRQEARPPFPKGSAWPWRGPQPAPDPGGRSVRMPSPAPAVRVYEIDSRLKDRIMSYMTSESDGELSMSRLMRNSIAVTE